MLILRALQQTRVFKSMISEAHEICYWILKTKKTARRCKKSMVLQDNYNVEKIALFADSEAGVPEVWTNMFH